MADITVLLAGGGTGGHIYPNVAIMERWVEARGRDTIHFLVSNRPGDDEIMRKLAVPFTASPARPLPSLRKPWQAPAFGISFSRALAQCRRLIREAGIGAVVATGGFVSGPAVVAAMRAGIPRVLVNLDAVPGQANRRLAGISTRVFSVYASPLLPDASLIGLPLRRVSVERCETPHARAELGLDPDLPLLFVTGATHGAQSVIETMMALVADRSWADRLRGWQVFHQCGTYDVQRLQEAYDRADVRAEVVAYCDRMGLAWRAADIAISRAGAGSVAEAWANATPTIFLPNPYHRDQHQRHNAEPLANAGGALIVQDTTEAARNVELLGPHLAALLDDPPRRAAMREALRRTCPPDGATEVARWLDEHVR